MDPEIPQPAPSPAGEPVRTVLLVAPEQATRESVRRMIAPERDMRLHHVDDPLAGIDRAAALRPLVILHQLGRPANGALEAIRRLQAGPVTAGTPVVVIARTGGARTRREAFAAGASDFLVEPLVRAELVARVRYHASARHALLQRDEAVDAARRCREELRRAAASLEEQSRTASDLLGMAVHDLRNPLTVLLGFSKYLLRAGEGTLTEPQRRMLGSMQSSGEFMLRLVDNLLELSGIGGEEGGDGRRPTDLAELVRGSVSTSQLLARGKDVEIALRADAEVPTVWIDPVGIERVLGNLLSNAVRFAPPGSRVEVELGAGEEEVSISVRDQGPGVAEGELDTLFQPLARSRARGAGGEKGTGLGLAIARRVVDRHAGRIWVEPTPGGGATFFVSIPYDGRA